MLLSVENLTKTFQGLTAVDNVSFEVHPGEIVGLIGPNGAGKTTLLSMVAGALAPSSGQVRYGDETITGIPGHQVARRGIVRTYQRTSLFGATTVLENVRIGCHLITSLGLLGVLLLPGALRAEENRVLARTREILRFVGLDRLEDVRARDLSYGDQRRLGIATALAANPRVLMLDEPAAGMNPEEVGRLMSLVRSIRERDVTVLLVEHNMGLVMNLCDRLVVLDHGVKIAQGAPEAVSRDAEVIRVYLGRSRHSAESR